MSRYPKGTSLNADEFIDRSEYNTLDEVTEETAALTPGDALRPITVFDERDD